LADVSSFDSVYHHRVQEYHHPIPLQRDNNENNEDEHDEIVVCVRFFKISLLDADPVAPICLARTRFTFRSDTLRCKPTAFVDE
jgi:hypothetical protein